MDFDHFPAIRRRLLRWYDRSHRDLPWRRTADPYAIWIAETMLQQTQVTTVVPYYERFLKSFPTVTALAQAPSSRVLTLWSGLGYYRRAENLKKSARELVARHRGCLPRDYAALKGLPGVGAYTAGALMSIAFSKRYPAVDGNVRRVLGRLFNTDDGRFILAAAGRLVPRRRPGDFNQALMELGATVCTAPAPRCGICPIAACCKLKQHGGGRAAPRRVARPVRKILWPLIIVRRGNKILLRRRTAEGMLPGLWEFPGGAAATEIEAGSALESQLRPLACKLGRARRIGWLRHTITNNDIRAPVFVFESRRAGPLRLPRGRWRWVHADAVPRYPVSSMTLKALRILAAHEKGVL